MSSLNCELYGDVLVATFSGPINRKTSPRLSAQLLEAIEPATHVVCDLSDARQISSTGYRLLLHVYHLTAAKQGQIALVAPSAEVRETLNATGFRDFFFVASTLEDALDQVCSRSPGHSSLR